MLKCSAIEQEPCMAYANASSGEAALKPAEPRAGETGKMATMAILARAETGCRLTRDPDDTARRRGNPAGAGGWDAVSLSRFLSKRKRGLAPARGAPVTCGDGTWIPAFAGMTNENRYECAAWRNNKKRKRGLAPARGETVTCRNK